MTYSSHSNRHLQNCQCYIHPATVGGTFVPQTVQNPIKPETWGAAYHIKQDSSEEILCRVWGVTYLYYTHTSYTMARRTGMHLPNAVSSIQNQPHLCRTMVGEHHVIQLACKFARLCHQCGNKHSHCTIPSKPLRSSLVKVSKSPSNFQQGGASWGRIYLY